MRRLARRIVCCFLLVVAACPHGGCAAVFPGREPAAFPGNQPAAWDSVAWDGSSLDDAEEELNRGTALEKAGIGDCADCYFRACYGAWCAIGISDGGSSDRALRLYRTSLEGLLRAGQRLGRFSPTGGLLIRQGDQLVAVPVQHHGFPWQPSDFQRLHSPPSGHEPLLKRRYECSGLGLPLVIERVRNSCDPVEERFFEKTFFSATALLRFGANVDVSSEHDLSFPSAVLEFHNPLTTRSAVGFDPPLPLAIDLSGSLAKTVELAPRSYLAGFIEPGQANTTARLTFLEPYQPGKAPVVFIHGLYSDPLSWADMINDLRAQPGFAERYQIWVFRYPTGQGFLQTAATLRRELRAAVDMLGSQEPDSALRQITLVGHSMGGLIAKLQITYSDELVWQRLANRPLEEIVTTESTRALLLETCYFDPLPEVARVVFIASPHAGSLCSSAIVGRGAALLVEPSPQQSEIHEQLIRDNPNTFNAVFTKRMPTSIDMLVPSSPLLEVMQQMRVAPCVSLHNIVGVSHPVSLDGPSDGVVSIHSASHPDCKSVIAVNSPHAHVHRSIESSREVLRILSCR